MWRGPLWGVSVRVEASKEEFDDVVLVTETSATWCWGEDIDKPREGEEQEVEQEVGVVKLLNIGNREKTL